MNDQSITLPPVFSLSPVKTGVDPLAVACAACRSQVDDGTIHIVHRPDRLHIAVVLEPEETLARGLPAALVALVAMGDAIGSVIPAAIPVTFAWPDAIVVNEGVAGHMRIAADVARPERPAWMVLGFDIAIFGPPVDGVEQAQSGLTTLYEEGGIEVVPPMLMEAFGRQLLSGISNWQDEGLGRVREIWNGRVRNPDHEIDAKGNPKKGKALRHHLTELSA